MSDERLEAGEPCMVSISAGLRPIHKKAVVTSVKPKGYDVLCEGETTERHISEKKAKRLSGRKAPTELTGKNLGPVLLDDDLGYTPFDSAAAALVLREKLNIGKSTIYHSTHGPGDLSQKITLGVDLAKGSSQSVVAVFERTKPVPKARPRWRSAEYLKFVGEHDCCFCGAPAPSDAHHWGGTLKGMGLKFDDLLTVPLSRGCHDHFHCTGKLPGMTTAETHLRFRETQVALLVEWVLIKFQEVDE